MAAAEQPILDGRRAFAKAQALFAGAPIGVSQQLEVGWHGSSTHPESGAFGLVRRGAQLDDLIGDIVLVTFGYAQVFVYVLSDADLDPSTQLSLTRRAFVAIARPSAELVTCGVGTVKR